MSGRRSRSSATAGRRPAAGGHPPLAHRRRRGRPGRGRPRPSAGPSSRPPWAGGTRCERDPRARRRRRPRTWATCARCRSSATSPSSPTGRSWSRWGRPRCCARRRWRTVSRRGCAAAGKGWVTAEYSLLPGSSAERVGREAAKGKQSGRTQEIQRLIGRSLAGRDRPGRHGRAVGDGGLRRPPGRRRDPHGVDLRRLRGAARLLHPAGPEAACSRRTRSPTPVPRCRWAWSTGPACWTSTTPRTRGPRWT